MGLAGIDSTSERGMDLHPGTRRIELNLGYACNNRCRFCSEAIVRESETGRRLSRELTTQAVLGHLLKAAKRGFKHVTFLGGEPTLRRDFLQIVAGAKKLGYATIFLTSNGRRLADRAYAEKLIAAGLTRLYLSLHGPDAVTHDDAVRAPGAFDEMTAGMANLRALSVPFGLSSVIYTGNVSKLRELLSVQLQSGADRLFWAMVRPVGNAREGFRELVPRYTLAADNVRAALAEFPAAPLTVGHMPLCLMPGVERHVDELYWAEAAIDREVEKFIDLKDGTARAEVVVSQGHYKTKHDRCVDCRYVAICQGVHSEYVNQRGFGEFQPVPGEPVHDVGELRDERLKPDSTDET